jgi:cyclic beta-1,2-glucan synthetase
MAASHFIDLPGFETFDFATRHAQNREAIAGVHRANQLAAEAGQLVSPAAEWLLDNFYLVEENITQVRRDLPRRFYRNLPLVETAGRAQVPRALALAWLYAAHSQCEVTAPRLSAIVQGHQSHEALRIGELWAIPSILRFVLIEDLARLALRIERARLMRVKANAVVDLLIQEVAPDDVGGLLAAHEADAADDAFASQMLYRLRDGSVSTHGAVAWLERHLEARRSDAEEVLIAEQNRLSAGNVRIGNIVRSLRTIDDIDWMKWFASVSAVDATLRVHAHFAELDFA